MATFQPVDDLVAYMALGEVNMLSDTFKAMLTNAAPSKDASVYKADITEISAGNGYTAGGATLTGVNFAEAGEGTGIWQWSCNDPSWTASGGDIATHRYLVVYNDTHPDDILVGFIDRGSSAVIVSGNTRTWQIGGNGAFRITVS